MTLAEPIQRLCSMKNQVQLTPHQLETWAAVLSCFDADIVTRSCLEIGLSDDPFPDLGKIALSCEAKRRRRENVYNSGDAIKFGDIMLTKIADALELQISEPRRVTPMA